MFPVSIQQHEAANSIDGAMSVWMLGPCGSPSMELLGLPVLERLPGMDQQQVGGSALLPRSRVVDATPVRCHLVVGMYGMEDGGPSDS